MSKPDRARTLPEAPLGASSDRRDSGRALRVGEIHSYLSVTPAAGLRFVRRSSIVRPGTTLTGKRERTARAADELGWALAGTFDLGRGR